MDIPTHTALLARIEDFCAQHDIAETRFGREAINNPNFIAGLRREPPVSPTLDTLNKVRAYMERVDGEAKLRAPPPLELTIQEEVEHELPFGRAPKTDMGASSPTSSPTNAAPDIFPAAATTSPSCSAPDASVAASSDQPDAAAA